MTEDEERAIVVAEARSWIRTPYHVNAALKGHGTDCGMSILRIFQATEMIADFEPEQYAAQHHMHSDEEKYLGYVTRFAHEVAPWPEREPLPADVVLFKFGKCFSHGALVLGWPTIAHATAELGAFLPQEVTASALLMRLPKRYFSVWPRS